MKTAERIISVTVAALLLAAFALYAFLCPRADKLSVVLSGITFILIAAVILPNVRSMLAFFGAPLNRTDFEAIGERSRSRLHPGFSVAIVAFFAQLLIIFVIYLLFALRNGYCGTLFTVFRKLFVRSIPSFIPRSEYTVLIAFILNSIVVSVMAVVLYEFMLLDHDKRTSLFSVGLLLVSPAVFYLLMPFSGYSLLMLCTLLCLFLLKTARPLRALIFLILSVLVNTSGIILIVPFVLYAVKLIKKNRSEGRRISPEIVSLSLLLAFIIAAAAVIALELYIPASAYEFFPNGFRFFFETASEAAARLSRPVVTVCTQFLLLILLALFAGRLDFPILVHSFLFITVLPSTLAPSTAMYALLTCPTLPVVIGTAAEKKPWRTVLCILLPSALVLCSLFVFVN